MTPDERKTEMAATKVTPEARKLLDRIGKKLGLNGYTLFNLMISCIIKYADEKHQLDPKLCEAISIYDHFEGWRNMTSIAGTEEKEVAQAIYFFVEQGKKGQIAVLARPGFFGTNDNTYNVQDILDATIKAVSPHLHKRLTDIRQQLDTTSHVETLLRLCDMYGEDPDDITLREMFADCRRSEWGRPTDMTKYVAHRNKSIEGNGKRQNVSQSYLFNEVAEPCKEDKD